MNYVNNLNICGTDIKEIPCIKGIGAPTTATEGAIGLLYMNTDTGEIYKCTAVSGSTYTWVIFGGNDIDLSSYELVGETPQNFSSANERIVLQCAGGGTFKIQSYTVADLDNAQCSIPNSLSETKQAGIYYLTITSDSPWYSNTKKIHMEGLEAGVQYKLSFDMRDIDLSVFNSDTDTVMYITVYDANNTTTTIARQPILRNQVSQNEVIRTTFTAVSDSITVYINPVTSENSIIKGTTTAYRNIWINRSDVDYVEHTEIYNLSGSFSTPTYILKNIPKNVTVSMNPKGNVYILSDTTPKSRLNGKTCVCFGDSVTGNYTAPYDYPSLIGEATGMTVINGGFGGCRMSSHPYSDYDAFSMYRLADSLVTETVRKKLCK